MKAPVQWIAQLDGACLDEPDTCCPECDRPIKVGHLITPWPGSRFMWIHVDCRNPAGEPNRACPACAGNHSIGDDCIEIEY